MKKLIILSFLVLSAFALNAQSVTGSFQPIENEARVNLVIDLSATDIMGMTEEAFAEYEKDWKQDKKTILYLITSNANKMTDNNPRLGAYSDADYTIRLVIRAIDVKGNYDCDVILEKGEDVIAKGIGLYSKGGKFGTKLNLMKDGAADTGKKLGRFISSQL
ncbi:MAG: hypothetical protein J5764_06090 [Bacteroidales bacterium]|nr:hypothetical protein [Bacteroidales bacterium]